jgi:hypothetical protein
MSTKITRSDVYVRAEDGADWFNDFIESFANNKESASIQDVLNAITNKRGETVQGVVDKYREMVGLDSFANEEEDDHSSEKTAAEKDKSFMSHLDPNKKYQHETEGFMRDTETGEREPAYLDDMMCDECGEPMPLDVHMSAAGYYLGRMCMCGPYSRESGYFKTREDAEEELEMYKEREMRSKEAKEMPLSVRYASGALDELDNNKELKEDVESLCQHSGGTKNTHSIISYLRGKMGKDLVRYSDQDLVKYIDDVKEKYRDSAEESRFEAGKVGVDAEDSPEDNAADYVTHGKGK